MERYPTPSSRRLFDYRDELSVGIVWETSPASGRRVRRERIVDMPADYEITKPETLWLVMMKVDCLFMLLRPLFYGMAPMTRGKGDEEVVEVMKTLMSCKTQIVYYNERDRRVRSRDLRERKGKISVHCQEVPMKGLVEGSPGARPSLMDLRRVHAAPASPSPASPSPEGQGEGQGSVYADHYVSGYRFNYGAELLIALARQDALRACYWQAKSPRLQWVVQALSERPSRAQERGASPDRDPPVKPWEGWSALKELPAFELPAFELPTFELSACDLPTLELSACDLPGQGLPSSS